MRKIKICGIFAALLSLFSCNDKIDVQQAYDFGITTWYLQKTIKPGQPVEIRFYLTREGYYADAEFSIGYVQIEGDGVVYDTGNSRLINCRSNLKVKYKGKGGRYEVHPKDWPD